MLYKEASFRGLFFAAVLFLPFRRILHKKTKIPLIKHFLFAGFKYFMYLCTHF